MHISSAGLGLIKQFEGFSAKPYRCPAGLWTIGYGHTAGVTPETPPVTRQKAEELLAEDARIAEAAIARRVRVPLTQSQYDALVSFVLNIGESRFAASRLLRHLNAGNYIAAALEFKRWVHASGKRMPGLIARRLAETVLFCRITQ